MLLYGYRSTSFAQPNNQYCALNVNCTTQDGKPCTGQLFVHAVLMIDSSFVDRYSDVDEARSAAEFAFQQGTVALFNELIYANIVDVTFVPVHFTSTIAPNNVAFGGIGAHYDSPEKTCIDYNIAILFSGNGAGESTAVQICEQTDGHAVCRVGYQNQSADMAARVAHEIMHSLGIVGHLDIESDCKHLKCTDYLMCSSSGLIKFSECDYTCIRKAFCRNCECFRRELPAYNDPNHDCTGNPSVSIVTDQPFLIRGCQPDRSTANYTIDVFGNTTGFTGTLTTEFQGRIFDLTASTPTTPPSVLTTGTPNRLVTPVFTVAPNTRRTFVVTLTYDPTNLGVMDDSSSVAINNVLTVTAKINGTANGQPVAKDADAKAKSFLPLTSNPTQYANAILSGNPLILNTPITVGPKGGNVPTEITAPIILVNKQASIGIVGNGLLGNAILKISNRTPTQISGCDEMWKGISVGNRGILELGNVEIRDAQIAVELLPNLPTFPTGAGGQIRSNGANFVNNNLGIVFKSGSRSGTSIIQNTTFSAEGSFLPFYAGQSPLPFGGKGFCAVQASGGNDTLSKLLNIGNSSVSGLHYGILGQNITLNIRGINFEDIKGGTAPPSGYDGYAGSNKVTGSGIALTGGRLNATQNEFLDCLKGIDGNRGSVFAYENILKKMGVGIYAYAAQEFVAENNKIGAALFGIGAGILGGLYTKIQLNKVDIAEGSTGIGIGVANLGGPNARSTTVDVNTINMDGGSAAILLSSPTLLGATGNHLYLNRDQYGIKLEGGTGTVLGCNDLHKLLSGARSTGIYALHAAATSVNCNNTEDLGTGLFFEGELNAHEPVDVSGNTLKNHDIGLVYGAASVTGPQLHRGNIWEGSFVKAGARHENPFLASFSKYTVDVLENSNFMPPSVSPVGWFDVENDPNSSYLCPLGGCSIPGLTQSAQTPQSSFQLRVAQGTAATGNYAQANNWLAQRRLYQRFSTLGNPDPGNSTFSNFMAQSQSNGLAAYAELQTALRNAVTVSAADAAFLQAQRETAKQQLAKVAEYDVQLTENEWSSADSALLAQHRQLHADSAALALAASEAKWADIQAARVIASTGLLSQNSALAGSEAYQVNEKTVNDLFVQTIIANNTTLSPAQQGVLEAIAAQCPLSGGEAVLRSRALLLGLGVIPVVYNDEKLCFVQERPGIEDRQARRETSTTAFWAYPNPASEQFNLAWYGSAEAGLSFVLYDAVGRTVKNAHLPGAEGTVKISIGDLSNGVYYYNGS